MTFPRRLAVMMLTVIVGLGGLELGERLALPVINSFAPAAEARVGRPLTPVSVAGVARRTVRRCAVGVY
jgi:hypothetical protein